MARACAAYLRVLSVSWYCSVEADMAERTTMSNLLHRLKQDHTDMAKLTYFFLYEF